MIAEPVHHVQVDSLGIAWISDTRTKVVEVAMDQAAYGWDAEEIRAAHPHLSLAQIHAALSYYHDHKTEFDAQMEGILARYMQHEANAGDQLTRAELQKRLSAE